MAKSESTIVSSELAIASHNSKFNSGDSVKSESDAEIIETEAGKGESDSGNEQEEEELDSESDEEEEEELEEESDSDEEMMSESDEKVTTNKDNGTKSGKDESNNDMKLKSLSPDGDDNDDSESDEDEDSDDDKESDAAADNHTDSESESDSEKPKAINNNIPDINSLVNNAFGDLVKQDSTEEIVEMNLSDNEDDCDDEINASKSNTLGSQNTTVNRNLNSTNLNSSNNSLWQSDIGELPSHFSSYSSSSKVLDLGQAPGVSTLEPIRVKTDADLSSLSTVKGTTLKNRRRMKRESDNDKEKDSMLLSEKNHSSTGKSHSEADSNLLDSSDSIFKTDTRRDDSVLDRLFSKYVPIEATKDARVQLIDESRAQKLEQRRVKRMIRSKDGSTSSETLRHGLPRQTNLSPELERELRALQLRKYADPSRHYKGNDHKKLPTHFAIGYEVGRDGRLLKGPKSKSGKSYLRELVKDEKVQEATWKTHQEVNAYGISGKLIKHEGFSKKKGGPVKVKKNVNKKKGWKNKKGF